MFREAEPRRQGAHVLHRSALDGATAAGVTMSLDRAADGNLWQTACWAWVTLGVAGPTSTRSGHTRGCCRAYIGEEGQIPAISWRIASQCVPFQ